MRKSPDWEYEKEVRIVFTERGYNTDIKPSGIKFIIPSDFITSIYFGMRCNERIKNRFIKVIHKDLGKIPMYDYEQIHGQFKLKKKRIC